MRVRIPPSPPKKLTKHLLLLHINDAASSYYKLYIQCFATGIRGIPACPQTWWHRAHAIESDWSLTAVEPLAAEWRALVAAASWAWRTPEIGRKLYGIARRARFSNVALQVLTKPDTEGRLLGMIETVADYARESHELDNARIDRCSPC